jgi:hypothetical protein
MPSAQLSDDEAALLPQPGEVLAAGEQLVHVRLVPGVEDDRVARRVEHAVDGDRRLHHSEVRAQVPAGLGDVGDQERPHLGGEPIELSFREPVQITRPVDGFEDAHGFQCRTV